MTDIQLLSNLTYTYRHPQEIIGSYNTGATVRRIREIMQGMTGRTYRGYSDIEIVRQAEDIVTASKKTAAEKAIARWTEEVGIEQLASMFGTTIIDLGNDDNKD